MYQMTIDLSSDDNVKNVYQISRVIRWLDDSLGITQMSFCERTLSWKECERILLEIGLNVPPRELDISYTFGEVIRLLHYCRENKQNAIIW